MPSYVNEPECLKCTRHEVEDDLHVLFVLYCIVVLYCLFECPAYQEIRIKYGSKLFLCVGVNTHSALRVLMREPWKHPEIMNQEPKWVARLLLHACICRCRMRMVQSLVEGMCTMLFLQLTVGRLL